MDDLQTLPRSIIDALMKVGKALLTMAWGDVRIIVRDGRVTEVQTTVKERVR